jgi:hypothetical protein
MGCKEVAQRFPCLGGYRFFFFDYADAIGLSRYLPLLVYPKGRPDQSFYAGSRMESWEEELGKFWVPAVATSSSGTRDAMAAAESTAMTSPDAMVLVAT